MEVSGIDPEIVASQQAPGGAHGGVAGRPAQGGSGSAKNELNDMAPGAGSASGGAGGPSGAHDAHHAAASQSAQAAALAANQYAAAAAYGPPVPVQSGGGGNGAEAHARVGKRRVRLGWTEEETQNLMEGCKRHGVGNWKKILTDPSFNFNCRTAVDLKDRFRTSFPEEYSRLYPNARTHKVKRVSSNGPVPSLIKVSRKERRAFTADEDERLLQGFMKHGPAWSKIQRDSMLGLTERRSTDLRDRFRNAFPDRYTAAGYKGRSSGSKSSMSSGAGGEHGAGGGDGGVGGGDIPGMHGAIDDELVQQHNVMGGNRYIPNAQQQMMHYQQQYNPQATQYAQQGQRNPAQLYNPQAQQYQQYQQPQIYGMNFNASMPMQMANMNQLGQMNPQVNAAQMRQMPQMNINQMGVWPNQQQ